MLTLAATPALANPQPSSASLANPQPSLPIYRDTHYSFAERAADLVSRMTLAEKRLQLRATTQDKLPNSAAPAIPRLGVPAYNYWNEALHGVARAGTTPPQNWGGVAANNPGVATEFPTGLGIASIWDPGLTYQMGQIIGDEARAYNNHSGKGLTYWSPTINMGRDPRWGRADETYGEDPYLTGLNAQGFVHGVQGDDQRYLKAVATPKHFLANNNDYQRTSTSSNLTERELREYYTPAFAAAAGRQGGAKSLMTAYNSINGVPAPANFYTIETLLRRTWGFDGFVTSDCGAIQAVYGSGHDWRPAVLGGARVSATQGIAWSLKAGTDLDCEGGTYGGTNGTNALNQGLMTEADIDIALVRAFKVRMALGQFDDPTQVPWTGEDYSLAKQISNPAHLAIAREMSMEAPVLLKNGPAAGANHPILPLTAADAGDIVVVGEFGNVVTHGDYSPTAVTNQVKPIEGIAAAATTATGTNVGVTFIPGNSATGVSLSDAEREHIRQASVVIATIGTKESDSSENGDRSNVNFLRYQAELVAELAALNPRVVVYIQSVSEMNIEPFRALVPAIFWTCYNGEYQGDAMGALLFGLANPSGRLPFTWYSDIAQLAAVPDYTLTPTGGKAGRTYQYFTGDVTYPFGHGLSYSDFQYSNLRLDRTAATPNDTIVASVDVTNTSSRAGKEVVQLYAVSPVAADPLTPDRQLKGFAKVSIGAGQTRTVSIPVKAADLWFWDEAAARRTYTQGLWHFFVGSSSSTPLNAALNLHGSLKPAIDVVTALPDGVVLNIATPGNLIHANLSATRTDQSFYNLAGVDVAYTSSDSAVAAVSGTGAVSPVGPGLATITATVTADGGSKSTSFPVVVYDGAVTSSYNGVITTLFDRLVDFPDQQVSWADVAVQLAAKVVPSSGNEILTYSIAPMDTNSAKASVTSTGLLTAGQPGRVEVTVVAQVGTVRYGRTSIVTVGDAAAQLATLRASIVAMNLDKPLSDDLLKKVDDASKKLVGDKSKPTCDRLDELIVKAIDEVGKKKPKVLVAQAKLIVGDAYRIEQVLGCLALDSMLPGGEQAVLDVIDTINGLELAAPTENDLTAKAKDAGKLLADGKTKEACKKLNDLDVTAAKRLTADQYAVLLPAVRAARSAFGC